MRICSIDIGRVNFAFCVTEYTSNHPKGNLLLFDNVNLSSSIKPKSYLIPVFHNMTKELNSHKHILDTCDYIVIEKQMNTNTQAIKLGQHCLSYFMMTSNATLVEFPSYYKTQSLNAPPKMTYTQRKKWAVSKATEILIERNDYINLTLITMMTKSDDLADVIIQTEAFLLTKDKVMKWIQS